MNLYAVKMAAVFMFSTCTLAIRTGFIARWIAFLGYALALFLLMSGRYVTWIIMVFPLWVLLVSIHILIDNLQRPSQARNERIKQPVACSWPGPAWRRGRRRLLRRWVSSGRFRRRLCGRSLVIPNTNRPRSARYL